MYAAPTNGRKVCGNGAPQVSSPSRVIRRAASPLAAVAVCGGGRYPGGMNPSPTNGRQVCGNDCRAARPHAEKTKKRDGHCPVSFFLKRRRKTERLAGACIEWKPPLYKWMPFLGNRQGALVFFLFYLLGKLCSASSALCFRCLNITLFLSRLQDADLYNL